MFNAGTLANPHNAPIFTFLLAQEMFLSLNERTVRLNGFYTRQADLSPPPKMLKLLTFTAAEGKPEGSCVTKVQSAKQIEIK